MHHGRFVFCLHNVVRESHVALHLLRELSQEVGVEVTPHTLRHGFAKALVDSAVGLEKVATLMGHTSLETTRIYTTPTQADLAAAVNHLDL